MKKRIILKFCAAAMSLPAIINPSQAQDRTEITTADGKDIDVYSVSQIEADKLMVKAFALVPEHLNSQYGTPAHFQAMQAGFVKVLEENLLEKFGVSEQKANDIATVYAKSPSHFVFWYSHPRNPARGLAAVPDTHLKEYGIQGKPDFCAIGTSDKKYELFAHFVNFTGYVFRPNEEALPNGGAGYSEKFDEFTAYHEIGHCAMGTYQTEPRADYWASVKMLSEASSPQELEDTVGFLKTVAALRAYNEFFGRGVATHFDTYKAIYRAIEDFQEDPEALQENYKITYAALYANIHGYEVTSHMNEDIKTFIDTVLPPMASKIVQRPHSPYKDDYIQYDYTWEQRGSLDLGDRLAELSQPLP